MLQALTAAIAQYDLVLAERELLEGTLQGSITALSEVLALNSPLAFARAVRVKACVGAFADRYEIPNRWQFEVAALLSQLGAASLPKELAEKIYFGQELTPEEHAQALEIPVSAAQIVSHVPRLDAVREVLAHQHRDFSAPHAEAPGPWGLDIPLGARLLRVAFDFDVLVSQGLAVRDALGRLADRIGAYDPDVLQDFVSWQREDLRTRRTRELTLGELRVGMTLAVDVVTEQGVLLIARGQVVTPRVMDLVQQYWLNQPIRGAVHVFLAEEADPAVATASDAEPAVAGA
jgi:response regulator RpfG family c-di-GMP phosphodiesterase